ncbi:MAG: hypothetical protein A2481_00640 [Candidatus Yonathbacteria bacterium RIFOXYC2_FULL_47_9]|nr:MAG: hypothetical protein A2481_00640 [Candidatus Yonathbacteria bacterium RIFOXYC2_FULL_47_9]HAT68143.1 hypothetical protein [Candidatus Yonathbacteria bacterium]
MQARPFPQILVFLVVAIAITQIFAESYYWYWLMRWFDMPMHFAGGLWVAGVVLWWRFFSGRCASAPIAIKPLFIWAVMGAVGIGALWEVYEAGVSYLTVGHMNDMFDTFGDLVFDILGGLMAASIVYLRTSNKQ